MPRQNYLPEFESQVRKAMDVPEVNANSLDILREQFVARGAAALRPDFQTDSVSKPFRPEKETKMKHTNSRLSPRLAWGLALLVLAILLAIGFSSPTVVNALRHLLGYIPGLGVVDQNTPFYVLAEPVSQTRAGITITVKDAVISSDKTIIRFIIENVPPDKLSPITDVTCPQWPELRLQDGTPLKLNGGDGNVLASNYEMRLIYAPMPADVENATLLIPCIQRAAPGVLPENWELSLRFIPAPPDMTVLPVIEITPSAVSETGTITKNPLSITRVIELDDGYILTGEFLPPPTAPQEVDSGLYALKITDGNGRDLSFEGFPQDIDAPSPTSPAAQVWAVKFSKGFVQPLHITYTTEYIRIDPSQESAGFEFDAGENPQEGQIWNVNKEFRLAGRIFTLNSIVALPNSYEFNFASTDTGIYSVGVDIDGYPPDLNGGGMDAGAVGYTGSWSVPVGPYSELPRGELKVIISRLWVIGDTKEWTINWQP